MIQVAICDDEPEILQELSGAVTDYRSEERRVGKECL